MSNQKLGEAGLRKELAARLRCRLPAVAAPMFLVSGVDMVAEACRAGMVGAMPSLNARTTEQFREWLWMLGERVNPDNDCAYAVNLVTHRTNQRLAADLKACVEARTPLIVTSLGAPTPAVEAVRGYGGLVFADVNTPALARKAAQRGADGLVLVCAGAGGHTGTITPFVFIEEVRRFFDGPLVLAGGISTGRGIRSALAMGADLAYLGTRFLAANESLAVEPFKDMVVSSHYEDIICTDAVTGVLANKLRPSLVNAGLDPESLQSGKPFDLSRVGDSVKKWKDLWSAGQGVGAVRGRESVAAIVAQLSRQYAAAN